MSEDTRPAEEWGDLRNQLDEDYPRSWSPNRTKDKSGKPIPKAQLDAPEIMGTVIRVDWQGVEWQGANRMVPVLILATHPEGELRSVWGVHKTLHEDMQRQDLRDGDRVAIRYEGKRETKDGSGSYHAYKLAVRRGGAVAAAPVSVPATQPDFGDEPPE